MRVVSLLRMFFYRGRRMDQDAEMMREASELLRSQQEMLLAAAQEIGRWQEVALVSQKATRDLAIAFRVSQDVDGVDIRDDLDELVRELQDAVGLLEEQIVLD